jgi:hypothetical protein
MTDGYGIPLDRVLAGATMETMREVDPLMSRENHQCGRIGDAEAEVTVPEWLP